MDMIAMTSACARTTDVLLAVHDDQLDGRTPCERLTLRELVAHVGGLGSAFAAAARKDFGELTDSPPGDGGYQLVDDWRAGGRRRARGAGPPGGGAPPWGASTLLVRSSASSG